AVELADAPGRFRAHAVDRAHEVAVGHRVRGLLQFPEVFAQSRHRGGGIEHDLRAGQAERARALREVAVVADVDTDLRKRGLEDRIAQVPRPEVELLPEPRLSVGDVGLAVFAQVFAVGVDDGRSVVVDARLVLFVYGDHDHHLV